MARWQLTRQVLHKLKLLVVVGVTLTLGYFLPSLAFTIPAVQSRVADWLSDEMTELLGAPVQLSRVSMNGWSTLDLDSIQIVDSLDRPMVQIRGVYADFAFSELLTDQRLRINSLRLFTPQINLHRDTLTGRLNISSILDRLGSTNDESETSSLSLSLHSVLMRAGSVSYHEGDRAVYSLDSMTMRLSRLTVQDAYIGGMINELSLRYNKALKLSDLSTQIELKDGHLLSVHNLVGAVDEQPLSVPYVGLDLSRSGVALIQQLQVASLHLPIEKVAHLTGWSHHLPESSSLLLQANIRREEQVLHIEHLGLSLADSILYLDTQAQLYLDSLGLPKAGEMNVRSLRAVPTHLLPLLGVSRQSISPGLREDLQSVGTALYEGLIQLLPEGELTLNGQIRSGLGVVRLDFSSLLDAEWLPKTLKGYIATPALSTRSLLPESVPISSAGFTLEIDAERRDSWYAWQGKARTLIPHLSTKGSQWSNIHLDVQGKGNGRYQIELNNAPGRNHLATTLAFNLGHNGIRDIVASVETEAFDLSPFIGSLHSPAMALSMRGAAELSQIDWQAKRAKLHLNHFDLDMAANEEKLSLDGVQLSLEGEGKERLLQMHAPWLDFSLRGIYRLEHLTDDLLHTLYRRVPILYRLGQSRRGVSQRNDFTMSLRLDSIPSGLNRLIPIDIKLGKPLELQAQCRGLDDLLEVDMTAGELSIGERWVKDLDLRLSGNRLRLACDAEPLSDLTCLGSQIDLSTRGDSIYLSLNLGHNADGQPNGEVQLRSLLSAHAAEVRSVDDLRASIELLPSTLHLHRDLWSLSHATIDMSTDRLDVQGLGISTQDRHILVRGTLGQGVTDQLDIDLKNIHLRYILEAAGVDFTLLDTPLTGSIYAKYNASKVLEAYASVHSPQFLIDGYDACALEHIGLGWNSRDMMLDLHGTVVQPHGGGAEVRGSIKLEDGAGIDLGFDADGLDLSFLSVFLSDLLDHTSGYGSGHMRLFGLFEQGVTIEGKAMVQQGEVGVRALGTRYRFADSVYCSPSRIMLDNIQMTDVNGRTARAVGELRHQYFDNWQIDLNILDIDRLLLLNKPEKTSLPIYGTAYGSGTVRLRTENGRTRIATTLRSEEGTSVKLDFTPSVLDRDHSLMRFTNLRNEQPLDSMQHQIAALPEESSPLDMDFDISITPKAQIGLILGADATDEIKGVGEGEIKINVPAQGSSTVQGTVNVLQGEYRLRAMQLTNKVFKVREGGTVAFRGDPTEAQLNLSAVYGVTANIADLDEDLSSEIRRTHLPVNCVLNLRGDISKPEPYYAIELPNADAEVERRVKSLLNTPEEIAQQVLYLIALGKFNPTNAQSQVANNNLSALASTLLSEQLSTMLGSLSEQINLSTRIKMNSSLESETEVDILFNGSFFSDRLLVSGNVGYHDNVYLSNQYVGEFNLEYKISRSGDLRFKGFNKQNTMYQYIQRGAFTQGIGLAYRTRFHSFGDLLRKFRPWRRRSGLSSVEPMATETADSLKTLPRDTIGRGNDQQ